MQILLTGGTGFLGAALSRRLVTRGHDVIALVRQGAQVDLPTEVQVQLWPATQSELRSLVADNSIDTCLHLAAHYVAEHGPDDIDSLVAANVGLTAAVADAVSAGGGRRLVSAGTVWQNAIGPDYQPVSLYAATKQAAQDLLAHFAVNAGLETLTVKLPDTYGPGDTRRKAVDLLLDCARTGSSLQMSPGEQLLDLVHVDDVVTAFVTAAEADSMPADEAVALTSGDPITLRALGDLVAEVTGCTLPIEWGARAYRGKEQFEAWNAGPPLPDWKPRVSLRDGLAALWTRSG